MEVEHSNKTVNYITSQFTRIRTKSPTECLQIATPNLKSRSLVYFISSISQQPSNSLHTTDTTHLSANDAALDSTTETTQAPFNSLKLKDFEEVTFDDGVRGNRVRREASTESSEAAADVADSTTIESSMIQAQESSFDSSVTLSPPSEPNYQHSPANPSFPYPPSRNSAAQYVSITQSPHYQPHYSHPIKSYYDFHPSQPDFIPYCINWFQNTFAPIVHDTWTRDYRKWK